VRFREIKKVDLYVCRALYSYFNREDVYG